MRPRGVHPRAYSSRVSGHRADRAIAGLRYLTLLVDDVAAMVDACVAEGCPVAVPVFEFEPGVHVGIVEDPDGNWVGLVQRST